MMISFYELHMSQHSQRLVSLIFTGILSVAAFSAAAEPADVLADHPLAGSIWSNFTKQLSTADDVIAAAEVAEVLLLGEKHDNATHHQLQAALIDRIAASRKRTALVWEMIEPTKDRVLADAYITGAEALGSALSWADSGWPDWREYAPIAAAALRNGVTMRGAALSRRQVRGLLGKEIAIAELVPRPLDASRRDALLDHLEASHCGAVPRTALAGMADVQIARDATLARVVSQVIADKTYPVVITGGGHARRDRGVPWHLPRRTTLVVAFVEVQRGEENPALYLDKGSADFIWFTPRVDEKDPCLRFRR